MNKNIHALEKTRREVGFKQSQKKVEFVNQAALTRLSISNVHFELSNIMWKDVSIYVYEVITKGLQDTDKQGGGVSVRFENVPKKILKFASVPPLYLAQTSFLNKSDLRLSN